VTDVDDLDDGDGPDRFDDRLAAIARLIDTDPGDPAHHPQRVVIIAALLARAGVDALDRIAALLDRLGEQ
jgi:hypothetical protein